MSRDSVPLALHAARRDGLREVNTEVPDELKGRKYYRPQPVHDKEVDDGG